MQKSLKVLILAIIAIITIWFAWNLFIGLQHKSRASAAPPTLVLDIAKTTIVPGEAFSLNFTINPNGTPFNSFDATFSYDASKLVFFHKEDMESNIEVLENGVLLTKKNINIDKQTIQIQGIVQKKGLNSKSKIEIAKILFTMKLDSELPLEFKWKDETRLDVENIEKKDLNYNIDSVASANTQQIITTSKLHNKMIWVARTDGQFTEKEFTELATYDIVIIEATHGGDGSLTSRGDIQKWHAAAIRLKSLNPKIKIFPYFNVSMVRAYMDQQYFANGFNEEWYLTSSSGKKVTYNGKPLIHYIDITNPRYRNWAMHWVSSWFALAPYDGVAFDTAVPLSNNETINEISSNKAKLWNQAMIDFLSEAKQSLSDKIFFVNGVNYSSPDYNIGTYTMLKPNDIIFNERFCIGYGEDKPKIPGEIQKDIDLTIRLMDMGLVVLNKTNYTTWEDPSKNYGNLLLSRFCYAASLMAYRQNRSYYKFGIGYFINKNGSELKQKVPEMDIELGQPISETYTEPQLLLFIREFTNGVVYLNAGGQDRTVQLPSDSEYIQMHGLVKDAQYPAGSIITVPLRSALFFIKN